MSWHAWALVLGLGVLTGRSSAAEDTWSTWYRPVAGIVRVLDPYDALFPAAPEHSHFGRAYISLLEESEASEETRAHVDDADAGKAIGHGAILAAGSGVGAWKTGDKITFAGANTAATNKVVASATSGNALVEHSEAAKLAKVKVKDQGKQKHPVAALGWMMWIRASLSIGFLVKTLCMMCNIFYQASPLPLISEYNIKGTTGSADLAPFIALCYGGWQWCFYGMFAYVVTGKSGFLVLVYSNIVGATLGLYYVYTFTINCRNAVMLERSNKYYYVLVSIVAIQLMAIGSLQPVRALFFSGLISSAWSTVASASLLATVPVVYETKNSKSLPLPLLVMGLISGVLWIVCGVMLWDPWITFPNLFALGVCCYALHLCIKFPPDHSQKGEDSDSDEAYIVEEDCAVQSSIDVERASPLQRALDFVSRSSASSENLYLQDAKGKSATYGGTCGTGGTGDSF